MMFTDDVPTVYIPPQVFTVGELVVLRGFVLWPVTKEKDKYPTFYARTREDAENLAWMLNREADQ